MTLMNSLLGRLFEVLLAPLRPLPFLWSVGTASLGTAVAILLVMRTTSDRQALAAVRRQMYADLLEIRLFRDDLYSMWRAQLSMCRHNARYCRLMLVPALWIVVPLALATAQLECYFGYAGSEVGTPVLVTATLKSPGGLQGVTLDAPPGTRLETGAVWLPAIRQLAWRVIADSTGDYVLRLRTEGMTYEKTLHVSPGLGRRSRQRSSARLIDQVRYPSEVPLPESAPFSSIGVEYPERRIDLFGVNLSGMGAYLVLSIVFTLVLGRPLEAF
jgi:hypothetical protein